MILHIPHSSGNLFGFDRPQKDLILLTDWYTDELFFHENSDRLVFDTSRLLCDVERFPDDKEPLFKDGFGICYTKTIDGNNISFDESHKNIMLTAYYEHHKNLNILTQKQLTMKSFVVVVDCHSFDPKLFGDDVDFCIGVNDDKHPELLDNVVKFIENNKYSVKVNEPFQGAIVPTNHTDNIDVTSIMIEINKRLYLEENSNNKNKDFEKIQSFINKILNIISEYEISKD